MPAKGTGFMKLGDRISYRISVVLFLSLPVLPSRPEALLSWRENPNSTEDVIV